MSQEYYTKEHEWVRIEGDVAVCGISEFAQNSLGDVVFVELPAIGSKAKQGEQLAVVESVKAASEVYAPIDGEVVAVNDALAADPSLVNAAPLSAGWFFKLKPADAAQAQGLMDEKAYAELVKK
ncbi:MAG: glycine cleavage system protein GcvH [Alphaproteobacteria bacterium]